MWTQQEAIEFCKGVEAFAPLFGYHVALTGGLLYKDGSRKDLDVIFYDHCYEDGPRTNQNGLMDKLSERGCSFFERNDFGSSIRVVKATYNKKRVDFFFAELQYQ